MRNLFLNLDFMSWMVVVGQVLAHHDDSTLSERHRAFDRLGQSDLREEVRDKSRIESKNFTTLPRVTSAPFSQSLATYTVDFVAFCIGQRYDDGFSIWEYTFEDAMCEPGPGDPRRIQVDCHAWYHDRTGPARRYSDGVHSFRKLCPENTVCQRVVSTKEGRSQNEVVCVDEEDVKTDKVTSGNSHADPNVPNVHCGTSLAIPGSVFTVKPGVQSIDITLTEEARYHDGTPYPAPILYIRDKTSRWRGFDRVFRRDASVASTRITLSAVAGKFQTRIFDFCMQLSPEIKAGAVTFTYSWFQTTSRHGRPADELLLEQDIRNDTRQY